MDNILQANIIPGSCVSHSVYRCESSSHTNNDQSIVGGYFQDGTLCWLAKGSLLTVLCHATSKIISYKNFNTLFSKDVNCSIVLCKAYSDLLLVGLSLNDEKSMLCLFNYRICKIVKAIYFPNTITCAEVILEEGGATHSSKPFAANLRWFFGVVAVGTTCGHLYLVDLRLDDDNFFEDPSPSIIEVVPSVVRDIPKVRDEINCRHSHLAFDLLDHCHEDHHFHYVAPDDQILKTYFVSEVAISSLFFEPRCTSLFVGLSFGQFFIVDLKELTLSFSSGMIDTVGSICNFVFQEPENDPKNFCYLWVVQDIEDKILNENTLHGTMCQLIFAKKNVLKQGESPRSLYTGLESCNPRFQLSFDDTFGLGPSVGSSHVLQCTAIERYHPLLKSCNEDDYNCTPYSSVFVTTWLNSHNDKDTIHMLLFDINCWYMAQMPASCRGFSDDEIFVTLWSLNCIADVSEDPVLAVCTAPSSLHNFHCNSHPTPRQFTYPSSYSLKTHCLTTRKLMSCKLLGVQDQAIDYLLNARSESLINPDYIFEQMSTVGLTDQCVGDILTVDQKREAILSAALKHDIFAYLSRVISDLSTGEHAASGCSLRFILEWAWKQTALVKDAIDSFCVPVFDCSVVSLNPTSLEVLCRKIAQIENLHLVFKRLKQAEKSSQLSLLELDVKHSVICLIQDYLKLLRWFIGARLLPEQLDEHLSFELNSYTEFHFIYKQKELRATYEERRSELKEINRSSESSLLIIDGLIEEAGKDLLTQWRKTDDNSIAKYPPPSLYALLSMYYLESVEERLKHTITTYFLLDILAVAETTNDNAKNSELFDLTFHEHKQTVSYFPQTFQLPPSQTKLIKAFWLLDHRQFQESCWTFCESGTERVTSPWQHRRIIQAYMMQGHAEHALQYLVAHQPATSCVDDVRLHIDVLVKNRKLHHALNIAQVKGDPRNREAIYSHLFSSCHKHDALPDLLKLTISDEEEQLVGNFLKSSSSPHSLDILILHLLTRCRYVDAVQLFRKHKHLSIMTKHDEIEKGYHATLNHIVQGYLNFLPSPLKDYARAPQGPPHRRTTTHKEVPMVRPLSSVFNSTRKTPPLSRASLLSLKIGQSNPGISALPMTPFRQKPTSSVSANHNSSLNSSLRVFTTDLQSKSSRKTLRNSFSSPSFMNKRPSLVDATESSIRMKDSTTSISCIPLDGLEKKRSVLMEAASVLLQTPPIQRSRRMPRGPVLDIHTPQSILKVRSLDGKRFSANGSSQSSSRTFNLPSSSSIALGEDATGKLQFNDQGLDSSGSESETPAWMLSTMTSQRKKPPKISSFMESSFNIQTPPVAQILRKSRVGFADTPRSESASSTKRLRFRDLESDASFEERVLMKAKLQVASSAGVFVEKTLEESDVNVTDVSAHLTESFDEAAPSTPYNKSKRDDVIDQPSLRQNSFPCVDVTDKLLDDDVVNTSLSDKDHVEMSNDVEETKKDVDNAPPQDAEHASETDGETSPDDIVLQLSDSSDHFDDAYPEKPTPALLDDAEVVLEISSDEEFSSPLVNNLAPSPACLSLNLIPSQGVLENKEVLISVAPDPSAFASTGETPHHISDKVFCLEPPCFPDSISTTDEEEFIPSKKSSDPQTIDFDLVESEVIESAGVENDDLATVDCSEPNKVETEASLIPSHKDDDLASSLSNEEISRSPLSNKAAEKVVLTVSEEIDSKTEVVLSVQENEELTLKEEILSVPESVIDIPSIVIASEETSSENKDITSTDVNVDPRDEEDEKSVDLDLVEQEPSKKPHPELNVDEKSTSVEEEAVTRNQESNLTPSDSKLALPNLPPTDTEAIKEIFPKASFKTPKPSEPNVTSVEPTFLLSPPLTRSRRKKPRVELSTVEKKASSARRATIVKPPVFEPETPTPQFIFSPPTTRTRSQRKRKIDLSDDVTTTPKTPRIRSPPRSAKEDPAAKTPVRSSRRLTAKRTASSHTSGTTSSHTSKTTSSHTSGKDKKTEVRRSQSEPAVTRSTDDDTSDDVNEQPTVTRTSSRRRQKSNVKELKSPAPSPVARDPGPVTPFPSSGSKLLRSHKKSAPTPVAHTPITRSSLLKESKKSSVARRTRASSVDVQPTVTNTSSRRKKREVTCESEPEAPPLVTRTSSRRKRPSKALSDDYVSTTTTRLRSKPDAMTSQSHMDQLDDIIEENDASSPTRSKPRASRNKPPPLFPPKADPPKVARPFNDKVRLLPLSNKTPVEDEPPKPRVTRSARGFIPIVARRTAKVHLLKKKDRK